MSDEAAAVCAVPHLYHLHLDKYLREMGLGTVDQPVEISVTIDKNGDGRVPCPVLIVSCECKSLNATICGRGVVVCWDCGRAYGLDVRHEMERVVATISALPEYFPHRDSSLPENAAAQGRVQDADLITAGV